MGREEHIVIFATGGLVDMNNLVGQRGVQPVHNFTLPGWLNYCRQNYDVDNGMFFFCKFR